PGRQDRVGRSLGQECRLPGPGHGRLIVFLLPPPMRLSLYRTLSLRYLQQRWSRAAMIVASIALGVATLVATQTLNRSMSTAAQVAGRPMAGLADLHVTNGDAGVERELAGVLGSVPGVRSVMPLLVERVVLP